jgi:hypothetical protein
MPRFLKVQGVPGAAVSNPWADAPVYVGTDRRREKQFEQVIRDHGDLRKAIAKGDLVLVDQLVAQSIGEAQAKFAVPTQVSKPAKSAKE